MACKPKYKGRIYDSIEQLQQELDVQLTKVRFQLATNGEPSNLTPEQYTQVRTPEFKAWFGDWENDPQNASKVVDENGEPLVVYHGTTQSDLTEFYGGWWSANKAVTKEFGNERYAAFLNIRNPLEDDEMLDIFNGQNGTEYEDVYDLDFNLRDYFAARLANLPNDGIITFDDSNAVSDMAYAVKEPTQIKSATENVGSFSPTNPDIRFSKATTSSNKFSKALSTPEMDLSFDKFRDLALLWKVYNPTKTEDDFYQYVKENVDRRVNKGFISAAFNDDPSYTARRMRAEMDTSEKKNLKESKAVNTMLRDPGTPQFLKDKLKELAGQYGQETHAEVERTANMILDEYGTQGALDQVANIPIPSVRVTVANKLIKRLNEMAASETNEEKKAEIYYTNLQLMDSTAMYLRQLGQGVRANAMYSKMDKDGYVYAVNRMLKATRGNIKKRHKTAIDSMVAYAQLVARGQRAKILTEDQKTEILSGGKTREQIRGLKERAAEKLRAYGAAGFSVSPLEQDLLEYGYYEFLDGRQDKASWVRHMKNKGLARAEELFDKHDFGSDPQNPQTLASMNTKIDNLVSLIGTKGLAAEIGQEMADMINKEHRKRVVATVKKKYERQLKKKGFHGQMAQALITAVEEGNYNTQALEDAMMHTMGEVQLSPEEIAEIDQIYKDAGFLPEGRLRDEKLAEAWDMIYRHRQDQLKYSDVFWAFYYANILSGPGTQALNFFENALNLFLEPTVQVIQELGTKSEGLNKFAVVSQMTKGVLRGFFGAGMREMASVVRTGKERFRGVNKYMDANALEQVSKGSHDLTWAKILRPSAWAMKYVPRVLGGMDAWFNQAHYELASVTSAARLVRQEVDAGVTEKADAKQRFYEIITQKDTWVNAVQDANIELTEAYRLMDKEPSGVDFSYRVKTRAREIVLKQRQKQATKYLYTDMDAVSSAVAAVATYTSPPRGALGVVANAFATMVKNVPAARFVIPFVNIVGNVYNRQLDYTPIGFARYAKGRSLFTTKDSPFGDLETHPGANKQRLIKSIIGSSAMIAAYLMFADDDDEVYKDPNAVTMHGRGPSDYNQRKEMEATGWRQYSFQVGKKFYTFNWTPFSIALSTIANLIDFQRYHKNMDDKPIVDQVFANLTLLGSTLLSPSMVKSAADFLDFFTEGKGSSDSLMRFVGRTTTTVLTAPVPLSLFNAFHGAADQQRYQADTFSESMIRNLPYFKAELRPALDAFGEPIKRSGLDTEGFGYKFGELSGMNRFVSTLRDNDTFWYLREKNLWPPVITKNRVLFGKKYSDSTHYEIGRICGPNIKKLIDANRANIDAELAYSADDADSYINGLMNNVIRQVESAMLDQFPESVVPTREEMAELADSGKVDWEKVKAFVDKAVYDIYLK